MAVAEMVGMEALADLDLSTVHGGKMRNAWACYGTAAVLGLAAGFGNQNDIGQAMATGAAGGYLNGRFNPACEQVPAQAAKPR